MESKSNADKMRTSTCWSFIQIIPAINFDAICVLVVLAGSFFYDSFFAISVFSPSCARTFLQLILDESPYEHAEHVNRNKQTKMANTCIWLNELICMKFASQKMVFENHWKSFRILFLVCSSQCERCSTKRMLHG